MYAERHVVVVTTDANGAGTGYSPNITGRILTIRYLKTDFAADVDFAITLEATDESLWTKEDVDDSATVCPRQATHDGLGAASLYAGAGEPVEDYIVAVNDRVKIAIAAGGSGKVGTFHVIVG